MYKMYKPLLLTILAVAALSPATFAQAAGIKAEAQMKIAQEKHEKLVAKAKHYLKRKAELETELREIDVKLEKLDQGVDVKDDTAYDSPSGFVYINGSGTITATTCCVITR